MPDSALDPPPVGAAPEARELAGLIPLGAEMARLFDHVARRHGSVTLSQFQLLAALRRVDPEPLEPREIGHVLAAGSAQVAALLDQLERAELLERRPHATDRRRREVRLTGEGRARADRVRVPIEALEDRLRDRTLTPDEAARLSEAVTRLRAAVGADLSFLLTANPGDAPQD